MLLDEVRAEAQREHQQRREHEEDLALRRRQDVAGDVLNPAVGAELDRADRACVMNSTNSSSDPIEKFVLMPTISSRPNATAHAR